MSADYDRPIEPQSLEAEMLEVLRACAGPTLRTAVMQRCKLATSAEHFSQEFGRLVSSGRVLAVSGHGPRAVYALSPQEMVEASAQRSYARTGDPSKFAFNGTTQARLNQEQTAERRKRIIHLLRDGQALSAPEIGTATGLRPRQYAYLLKQLADENSVQRVGIGKAMRYRLPVADDQCEVPAASAGQAGSQSPKPSATKRAGIALGATRQRVLEALKPAPTTARAIANQLGLSVEGVHYQLNALAQRSQARRCGSLPGYWECASSTSIEATALSIPISGDGSGKALPPNGPGLNILVRLTEAEVQPFFRFMVQLRASGVPA